MEDPDIFHFPGGEGAGVAECSIGAAGIANELAEHDAGGVEFEVEVTGASGGLDEEFDATVMADHILEMGGATADESVIDLEEAVESQIVIQEFEPGIGVMIAAFRPEVTELCGFGRFPVGGIEIRLKVGRSHGAINEVTHWLGLS